MSKIISSGIRLKERLNTQRTEQKATTPFPAGSDSTSQMLQYMCSKYFAFWVVTSHQSSTNRPSDPVLTSSSGKASREELRKSSSNGRVRGWKHPPLHTHADKSESCESLIWMWTLMILYNEISKYSSKHERRISLSHLWVFLLALTRMLHHSFLLFLSCHMCAVTMVDSHQQISSYLEFAISDLYLYKIVNE